MSEPKKVDLHQMFLGLQKEMFTRMETARKNVNHGPSKGDEHEEEWIALFQHFLPKRYQADKAFVVDCNGRISEQLDVVIFDRQYSPFLAKLNRSHYIPAESVYAVLEVKQELNAGHIDYAGKKAASVRALHRTTAPITHAGGTFQPRQPFTILTGFLSHGSAWKPAFGKPFNKAIEALAPAERIDIGCCLEAGAFSVDWSSGLPGASFSDKDTALVSFVLGFIKALQQLGTVPALDMGAYLAPLLAVPTTPLPKDTSKSRSKKERI